ncbi:toprim domain-containing protein [Belnapia sp. F-4-1]|uniref:toprim domain-containing protein n=1 Tax=Belnapia sp. F-4-1 TaxID=1545443 RepID=UPI00068BEF6C|nr:toprim domain-containing protein [Belnapia sp. F-4-1]
MTHRRTFDEPTVVAEFGDALRAAGFRLKASPVMDGAWHRAPVEGDRGAKKSGRYRGYLTGHRPAGFIENFKNPSASGPWKAGVETPRMSRTDRDAADALRIARDRAAEARLETIAQESTATWDCAPAAPADHPYLVAKRIPANGLRVDGRGRLLVPMLDFTGRLRALQTIAPSGRKLFPKGGKVHGLHMLLGEVEPGGVLLVAEGFATGATLHQATGHAVAVAFTKSNFVAVARAYGERLQGLRIAFGGDNDHHHPRRDPPLPNVGRDAAETAARDVGGVAILPHFEPHETGTDWNDYAAAHGLDAVRAAIEAALPPPPCPAPPPLAPYYVAPENTRADALAALAREVDGFFAHAAAHVAASEAWRKSKAALDEVLPPKSPGRRAALRTARAEIAAIYGADWRNPGRRLLVPAAAGAGKTQLTTAEITKRLPELGKVNFYIDTLDNAVAVASKIPTARVVRGRGAVDPKSPDGALMCLRYKAAEAVAKAGLPVGQTLCRDANGRTCPLFDRCGYQRDTAGIRDQPGAFVGSHEYLTLQGGMPSPDVAVIDESCVPKLIGYVEFGADRLLPVEMPDWQAAGLAAATGYREIMVRVSDALRDPAGILAGLRSRGIDRASALAPAIAFLRAVEEREYTGDITPTMDDAAVLERLERHTRSEISDVLKMLVALRDEIAMPRDQAHSVAFHPDKIVKVDGKKERQTRISVHYRKDLAFRADIPVLVLDASGDIEIYRRLLGGRLTAATTVQCDRDVEVVQVKDAALPRSSLLGTDRHGAPLSETSVARAEHLRSEMVATINALAARHDGEFMLATYMAVEAAVTADVAEIGVNAGVLTGHFGKLRGRNDYEDCPAGMVLGRNQPPPSAMEAMARAIWAADPMPLDLTGGYRKTERGIRMRDGSAVPVEVDVHPDPRVQRVLELHRERESEQAADRLRLIHNTRRKVLYVACNLPLNLTVDRVVTRRGLVHEATGRVDNGRTGKGRRIYGNRLVEAYRLSGGILPLSRHELSRVFKGLWPSERRAREDLGKMAVSAIQYLLAETAIYRPVLVAYKLEGQKCPSRALISPEIADGRAALQALLGRPIVAFEAQDDDPEPPDAPQPSPPAAPAPEPAELLPKETAMLPSLSALRPMRRPADVLLSPDPAVIEAGPDAPWSCLGASLAPAAARLAALSRRLELVRPPRAHGDGLDLAREAPWRDRQAAARALWPPADRAAWPAALGTPAARVHAAVRLG